MKAVRFFWPLVLIAGAALAQAGVDALIKFDKTNVTLGKIKQNKPVTVKFSFSNPGSRPLIIADATAECGCTSPEFPKKPIAAGGTGIIIVTYDAKEAGVFTKRVTISLVNVKETKVLTLTGEVVK
jgi:hypothetical protein